MFKDSLLFLYFRYSRIRLIEKKQTRSIYLVQDNLDNLSPHGKWILKSFSNKEEYQRERDILTHLASMPDFPQQYFCTMKHAFFQNIVFPYCNRMDLHQYLYNSFPQRSLKHQDSITFIHSMLNILVFLQDHSFQHYDIKLENIFVHEGSRGTISFQLGDMEYMDINRERKLVGTFRYMCPELIYQDLPFECCKCDIFSFGRLLCMLFISRFDVEIEKFSTDKYSFSFKIYNYLYDMTSPSYFKYSHFIDTYIINVIDTSLFLEWIRGHCHLYCHERFTARQSRQFFLDNYEKMFLS